MLVAGVQAVCAGVTAKVAQRRARFPSPPHRAAAHEAGIGHGGGALGTGLQFNARQRRAGVPAAGVVVGEAHVHGGILAIQGHAAIAIVRLRDDAASHLAAGGGRIECRCDEAGEARERWRR